MIYLLIIFILVVGTITLVVTIQFLYSQHFSTSSKTYRNLADTYGLRFSTVADKADIGMEYSYAEQTLLTSTVSGSHTPAELSHWECMSGLINGHFFESVNICFTANATNSWRGFVFGGNGGNYGSVTTDIYTTRLKVDGVTKHLSMQNRPSSSVYGNNFAAVNIIKCILSELATSKISTSFNNLSGCNAYGTILGITTSYICSFNGELPHCSSAMQIRVQNTKG